LMALMTFGESGPAEFATSPEAAAVTLDALGVDVLGISSGLGIDDSRDLLTKIRRVTNRPLVARLNAGPPEDMTAGIPQLIDLGVRVIGGCCGSNPLPMPTPAGLAQPWQPPARRCFLSSRTQVIEAGGNSPCRVIGERINPTGKQGYSDELRRGETIFVRREAREQVAAGAELLDINCWVPGVAEPAALERTILAVGEVTDVPLVLDSTSAEALESGLKTADGKVLINSVSGEEKSLRTILPLAKQYGAAIVALALDDSGLPKTAQGRFEVAEKILTAALEIGLPREDVIVDCLALPVSVGQGQVMETLQALRLVRDELGLATLLGVSNISFGLPRRPALTSVFFAMALEAGLKAAIINPKEERIMDTLQSARVLLGEDLRGET